MAKRLIKTIKEHIELYRCDRTGIAWIENGETGNCYSAHPNIDASGSVRGMKNRGWWRQNDRTVKTHGTIYNIDKLAATDDLDLIAAEYCQCEACKERRNG